MSSYSSSIDISQTIIKLSTSVGGNRHFNCGDRVAGRQPASTVKLLHLRTFLTIKQAPSTLEHSGDNRINSDGRLTDCHLESRAALLTIWGAAGKA